MKYPQEMFGARMFMSKLASEFTDSNKAFVLMSHINLTSVPLIESLNKSGRIAGIITKPNSINYPTYEKLFDKYRFLEPDVVENLMTKEINILSEESEK